jgi:hypothetical protein
MEMLILVLGMSMDLCRLHFQSTLKLGFAVQKHLIQAVKELDLVMMETHHLRYNERIVMLWQRNLLSAALLQLNANASKGFQITLHASRGATSKLKIAQTDPATRLWAIQWQFQFCAGLVNGFRWWRIWNAERLSTACD